MKEVNKVTGKVTLEEQEKYDPLDDNTREVVDEYSRKFLVFIQQEKDRARKNALGESEKIIAEAEKKGHLAYEKAVREANAEAENIIARALDMAKGITTDTDKFIKVANEVRDNTEKEIEHARTELRRQADTVIDFYRKQEKALNEIGEKLQEGFDASFSMLVNLKQEIEQASKTTRSTYSPQPEVSSTLTARPKTSREETVTRPLPTREEPTRRQGEKTYVGTINIDVYRKNPALSKRFREALAKVPGFEISMVDDSAKDRTKIVAYANQPLPIMNVLHQMSMVRSAMADEDTIKVVLHEGDTWVG
jgi:F0F1-type ATP synthase membrane subunit b/b'